MQGLAGEAGLVDGRGLGEGLVARHGEEGADLLIDGLDPRSGAVDDIDGRDLARPEALRELSRGEIMKLQGVLLGAKRGRS
ncbi:hypothetical protein D3C87_2043470 [compost metagenome]